MPSLPVVGASSGSWGTTLNTWLLAARNADGSVAAVNGTTGVINVQDPQYGATGNGTTDDTAAIQAAIDAATGAGSPTTTTRVPVAPVYLPPGNYKVTSDLMIRSVLGFVLRGAGIGQTIITASGTGFTQAVLFIDGSADGVFEGLDIRGDGTEKCGTHNLWDGLRLDWVGASRTVALVGTTSGSASITCPAATSDVHYYDVGATITGTGIPSSTTITAATPGTGWTLNKNCTATGSATVTITATSSYHAARSTTGNVLRDIRIRALKFVNGLSLEGNGSAQVDGTYMANIVASGAQTPGSWSSSGLYQTGFVVGNGVFSNNYDHAGFRVDASGCYYGMKLNVSSMLINGSQPAGNFSDFWLAPAGQSSIINIQSQNSGQFLINSGGFSPNPVTIQDVISLSVYPQSGNPIITVAGGIWAIKNFEAGLITLPSTWDSPVININGGGTSTHPAEVVLENIALNGSKTTCIQPTATQSNVSVRNYCNYNPATGLYTTDPGDIESYYTGSAWSDSYPSIANAGFSTGIASQLSDLTRDYIVYFVINVAGTMTLQIGPTSSVTTTIVPTTTPVASGAMYPVRLPAGWYLKITLGSSATIARQTAVGYP